MKNKYIVHNRPVDILMEWLPKTGKFYKKIPNPPRTGTKFGTNLKGFKKKECEPKIKLSETIKEIVFTNQMSDEEFKKYKY